MELSKQLIKFLISGGISALTSFSSLYVFTEFFNIWYLFSVVIAFFLALLASFLLQKFWTFNNRDREKAGLQFVCYSILALLNLTLNVSIVYFLVEKIGLWYMFAQFFAESFIALESFFVYKFVIFGHSNLSVKAIIRLIDFLRTIYNRLFYFLLGLFFKIFQLSRFGLFSKTNGWGITLKRDGWVYKIWGPFFLLHPANTFKRFKKFHQYLAENGIIDYIPDFKVNRVSIKYKFLSDSHDLLSYLSGLASEEKVKALKSLAEAIDYLHRHKVVHNDLKPKNILVNPQGRVYFIDFENSFITDKASDYLVDYEKLIPRIIYLFNFSEISSLLGDSETPERFKLFISRYVADFDYKKIISGLDFISKEKDNYFEDSEDIDITVDSLEKLKLLIKEIKIKGLDSRLFFYAQNDIKLYVFNLKKLVLLDVHLRQPLGKALFLWKKIKKNPPRQVALTGPDGAGKTFLLAAYEDYFKQNFFAALTGYELYHSSRFAREIRPADFQPSLMERFLNKITHGYFIKLVLYSRLLRKNKKPLVFFDRSFYDPFISRSGSFSKFYYLWLRLFLPKNILLILLKVSPGEAVRRKQELREDEIEKYYFWSEAKFPIDFVLKGAELEELLYRFNAICSYYFLTGESYL